MEFGDNEILERFFINFQISNRIIYDKININKK